MKEGVALFCGGDVIGRCMLINLKDREDLDIFNDEWMRKEPDFIDV